MTASETNEAAGMLSARRQAIVEEARSWIGTPYRHQASLKGVGCDCVGLVRGIWRALYGAEPEVLPAYAPDWAEASGREPFADALARHCEPGDYAASTAGDIVLFRWRLGLTAKHAAIMSSAERMIHAHQGIHVTEVALSPWWRRRIAYVFRFPGI